MSIELSTVDDGIVLVTLNRPERLNALDQAHVTELADVLDAYAEYGAARVVILTGAGRGFCAGLDLEDGGTLEGADHLGEVQWAVLWQRRFSSLIRQVRAMAPVVVSAVNGTAMGAGFALALASDLRIAGPDATFAVANVRIGLSGCDVGGICRVADDPVAAAVDVAREIAVNSPFGVAMTKEVMWANADADSLESALDREDRTQVLASLTAEMKEAVTAFKERRPPRFTNH